MSGAAHSIPTNARETAMPKPVDLERYHEIEQFYFREARLFNEKRYREWLDGMVDKEIRYEMPIFEDRLRADRRPPPEYPPMVYDDDWADLDERVRRLDTNLVWMEDPPSRIRHLITNVEAYETDNRDEYEVYSNVLVCRNKGEREETILVGGRRDLLRRRDWGLKVRHRTIHVPQRVVLDTNLYYFI
ncbi:MAG: aromatic-ring-hydroxylating dioxygenase subunit beta [Candidatus Binatia bacterium]